ncbi:hypothetical protein ACXYTJ_06260 [Gilvimarinus sp. F26214L]|uniref:hypothetical protein n=1 Tax=Gilvimarinus sp. DZF01 TaxID=3461371 RepID=UPI004045A009
MSMPSFKLHPLRQAVAISSTRLSHWLARPSAAVLGAFAPLVLANLPTDETEVGNEITHPSSGETLTVVELLDLETMPMPVVVAEAGDGTEYIVFGEPEAVPATIENPDPDVHETFTITDVVINADTGLVEQFILDDGDTDPLDVVVVPEDVTWVVPGDDGGTGSDIPVTVPDGNVNVVAVKKKGGSGGNGSDGGGIRICFWSCWTIGYAPTKGKDGKPGPDITETVAVDTITSITDGLPGITVSSIGGDGGTGGDSYGNLKAARGGSGGRGGNVVVDSTANITTSGLEAHGIFAQSRSGKAGKGGDGKWLGSGGDGGTPGYGGTVTVTNHGNIATLGDGAVGILAQSTGGAAGDGGDSWGLVGQGGSSLAGGHGGAVTVNNYGVIQTEGFAAHGIVAQSIGGTGGNGGDAGGIVSFGGGGSAGGDAGTATVNLGAEAGIYTQGDQAHGLMAQSIGGGGGSGGTGGGVVAFGGTGEAGGNGSAVSVNNAAGSVIVTEGDGSDAIIAQSIGGGGGDGGAGGALVALGGAGSAAGSGGEVQVNSGADLATSGDGSRGIFAQSVGGGGGSARGSGGVVSLGGSGGSGGDGGEVTVANEGQVVTAGTGSDAVIAQSIGGGGGSGGGGNGLAGIGGSGSSGGAGGDVALTNTGTIHTQGDRSRGLFAQSVGGGGGFGGDGAGVAAIGGAGSATSDGGNVALENHGAIYTEGERSHGIQAQSVGGGGGDGGTGGGVFFALGGSGGGGGDAGEVAVTNGHDVVTEGDGARGIFAQSVGGGGGNGGASYSGSAFAGVAIGGSGGDGGNASSASITLEDITRDVDGEPTLVAPRIHTYGDGAEGILSQSVGGGGGNGGQAVQVSLGAFGAVSAAVGGSGGNGGNADAASLTGDAAVVTRGEDSDGIVVQSVGGGGGSGGGAIAVAGAAGPAAGSFSFGMGGSGGGGGHGAAVTVDAGGSIHTEGDLSDAFLAQSVGGGGGKGGWVLNASVAASEGGSVAAGVGLGGSGGDGGDGAQVDVIYSGDIITAGDNADAWTAQSVGGGGGQGGFNLTGVAASSAGASGSLAFGMGGSGGGGGIGDAVTGALSGDVTTGGDGSDAVLAQSIGGGGGSGGMNMSGSFSMGKSSGAAAIGFGGSGGDGGNSGTVDLGYTGSAITLGDDANAVVAQSVGGGGGQGAMNVSGSIAASNESGGAVAFGMGGSGGGGGTASAVSSDISGSIHTEGARANGIVTQSVGGGGGNGGFNISAGVSLSGKAGGSVAVGLGGAGGDGGDGDHVDSTIAADVTTLGDGSTAVLTQSVGGGGGNGGFNISGGLSMSSESGGAVSLGAGGFGGGGGNAATASLDLSGDVRTAGDDADGVVVQSMGGGGGNGGMNIAGAVSLSSKSGGAVAAGLGGFGGGGGHASDASLWLEGDTITSGARSDAVTVQSVGGGGGKGGLNISGSLSLAKDSGYGASLGLGGFGGAGGDAGNVVADIVGDVLALASKAPRFTVDDDGGIAQRHLDGGSHGVLAQSVGGSGGSGGFNVSAGVQHGNGASRGLNLGVGGFGGSGGDAGQIDLNIAGNVAATGDYSNAVTAQSIGGGGGNGAISVAGGITGDGQVNAGIGGWGGDGGIARDVTASVIGDLLTDGAGSRALLVQSIGGGGGAGGMNISGGINASSSSKTPSLAFGMGGAGGDGDLAGNVAASQTGDIAARGRDSTAVLVQSIGGGGGSGALNATGSGGPGKGVSVGVGIGGDGGEGADAGQVSLISDGNIVADGRLRDENGDPVESDPDGTDYSARSTGILVQSVGGGGGHGGVNISGVVATKGSPLSAAVGGTGDDGGEAGAVTVVRGANEAATLETFGDQSNGLIAQSIGGGGGNAGMNFMVSGNLASTESRSYEANILIGGGGGQAGDGAATVVDHSGNIVTHGRQSTGLLAQSIGGGGGNAAFSLGVGYNKKASGINVAMGGQPADGGIGGTVNVDHSGLIATEGHDSTALMAQSIGGGGGNSALTFNFAMSASNKLDLALGRTGGTGGDGGDVTVDTRGQLFTAGDRSVGLFAQSVGNGGGMSSSHSIGFKGSERPGSQGAAKEASVGLSLGLTGGSGGRGGEVLIDTGSTIVTQGSESHAIHAQSTGGGGGVGGGALGIILAETMAARVALGGDGGAGGAGGLVNVRSEDILATHGDGAHGLYAQSIGGGGGTGGWAAELNLQAGAASSVADITASALVGGSGGTGGEGGDTLISNLGTITTFGESANGISAHSIGGGGGDGGLVLNGSVSTAGNSGSLQVGVGGAGGTGGEGGRVAIDNQGRIATASDQSIGIFAQSIGGGGGNAGLTASLSVAKLNDKATSMRAMVNVGGEGGTGGAGGTVDISNDADASIVTQGEKAYGIFAQSIGGGGGNGGSVVTADFRKAGAESKRSASLGVNVGGKGGTGGFGGDINVENFGLVETMGDAAHGVFAQSVGGGGGNGGIALATDVLLNAGKGAPLTFVVGGSGGDGGDGGMVNVHNAGEIVTHGDNAYGILAQSIGGGGGNGNVGMGLSNSVPGALVANGLSAALGAFDSVGGAGGTGGDATVEQEGDITVTGDGSRAVKVESINGGGGGLVMDFNGITTVPGGDALPTIPGLLDPGDLDYSVDPTLTLRAGGEAQTRMQAGSVSSQTRGNFTTMGERSSALDMQSVGGGGGSLMLNLNFAEYQQGGGSMAINSRLGGKDGDDNHGSNIASTHKGNLISTSNQSPTASLRSIGGGGGLGFVTVSGDKRGLDTVNMALGAEGSGTNRAGNVVHEQSGNVGSAGDNSVGFLAQSIGAGGGSLHLSGPDNFGVTLGGSNEASGNAGNIDLTFTGNLQTSGWRSHGLFLQSIGGGGGAVFSDASDSPTVHLAASNSGDGGEIRVAFDGDIIAGGAGAYGLFAQSLGGGGGYVDGAGAFVAGGAGQGAAIDIDLNGSVYSAAASAVYLQSEGADGAGDITLSLGEGKALVGGFDAPALMLVGGKSNHYANGGTLSSLQGVFGGAMLATAGDDRVDNFGTILGDVELGAGHNHLTNHMNARLFSGSVLDLGSASAAFRNSGTLAPGGAGVAMNTRLNGSYQQDADGLAIMELDFATATSDLLHATGRIDLAGALDIDLVNPGQIKPGVHQNTLFRAEQGIEDLGFQWSTEPSAVIKYNLRQTSGQEIQLTYDVDFTAHNQMRGNLAEAGNYFNRVQAAGSSPSLASLMDVLINTGDAADYSEALTQLSAASYAAQQTSSVRTAQQFGRSLMSCSTVDMAYRYERQGSCTWLRVDRPSTEFDAQSDAPAMEYTGTRTAMGGQKTEGNLTLGLGFSIEDFSTNGFNKAWRGNGDTTQLGGVIKYQLDDVLLTSSLVMGRSDTNMERSISLVDPVVAAGSQELNFVAATAGITQSFNQPWLTLRPLMELGTMRMRAKGETEGDAGALSLDMEGGSDTHSWFRPGLELGHEFAFRSGSSLRPYLRASLMHFIGDEETEVEAQLAGAPAYVEGMRTSSDLGQNQKLFEAGLDFMAADGFSVKLHYEQSVAESFETEQVNLKMVFPF